jgi:hypothetical protein
MMTIQKIFHAYFGNTKMTTAQKVLPIALSLVALATVGHPSRCQQAPLDPGRGVAQGY